MDECRFDGVHPGTLLHHSLCRPPIVGSAARLPVSIDSQDVVTACRVFHDLPTVEVNPALREAYRVCVSQGSLGVLEFPIITEDTIATPEQYWSDCISQAGFTITALEQVSRDRRAGPNILVTTPPRGLLFGSYNTTSETRWDTDK